LPRGNGKGRVTIFEGLLHLEPDFEVGPGPKFHVYLVPEKDVVPSTNVAKTMYVDLGRLKAFKGSQNYPVPSGVDVTRYGSVVVWCEQFGVLISPARLSPG
jgi:electron transfer DM13